MDISTTKILVAILFGLVRFFFGILPIKLKTFLLFLEKEENDANFVNKKREKQLHCYVALIQAFGGGVLFATCLLHMMPEVYYSVEELRRFGDLPGNYPYSQLIVSTGFFLVYFIEEFSHWLVSVTPEKSCDKGIPPSRNSLSPENKISPKIESFDFDRKMENEKPFIVGADGEESLEEFKVEMKGEGRELDYLLENNLKTRRQVLRCILIVLALSLHAIFEGLAIGLQHSKTNIWYLFTAVSIHSATVLFCVGLELLLAEAKTKTILIHMLVLALTSPIGVFLGLGVSLSTNPDGKAKSIAVVILEGLSAGTILYITFFEVLNREKERRIYILRRACFILSGFSLMAILECAKVYH